MMKALLVIDMQVGSFRPELQRYDAQGVVRRINSLSNCFRENGDKVIFIQHDGTKENNFIPGSFYWNILPALIQSPEDIIVRKTANDAFYNTDLQAILKEHGITELYISGCATDYCVDTTVRSALHKDYTVIVVKDCHTTADRPHLAAEKVIQHHNWLWENMIPTSGSITLASSKDLLKQ